MGKINMEQVIAGFRFIAENRNLSTDELADGLEKLGCNWTFDDWGAQFGKLPRIRLFDGMRRGDISCGANVIINMGSRNNYNRHYSDDRFLSVDDDSSVYHYVRLVTGDNSFTKENIEHKK
ncbi:hypothetical protein IKG64_00865 [Candidatus Saccharibacteria bacterium]|nr:hypothetical protein [Candidatus Saccharibacteria bacterium]